MPSGSASAPRESFLIHAGMNSVYLMTFNLDEAMNLWMTLTSHGNVKKRILPPF